MVGFYGMPVQADETPEQEGRTIMVDDNPITLTPKEAAQYDANLKKRLGIDPEQDLAREIDNSRAEYEDRDMEGYKVNKTLPNTQENYVAGVAKPSSEFIEDAKNQMLGQALGNLGQVGNAINSATKDPKTASIANATTLGMASTGMVLDSAKYFEMGGKYDEAMMENDASIAQNEPVDVELKNKLAACAQQEANGSESTEDCEGIRTDNAELSRAIKAQEKAASSTMKNKWSNYIAGGASMVAGAAAGYMAYMSYQMGKELDRQTGDPTQTDGIDCTKPEFAFHPSCEQPLPGPQTTPFNTTEGFSPGFDTTSDTNGPGRTAAGNDSGRSNGHTPSFLEGTSLGGAPSVGGKNGEKDKSDLAYSSDVGYGASGGGSAGDSAEPYVSLDFGAGSGEGFDISQFLPGDLKGNDLKDGFTQVNTSSKDEDKKNIVLGKDSPSLFSRVTHAYQKKGPQLKEEVI